MDSGEVATAAAAVRKKLSAVPDNFVACTEPALLWTVCLAHVSPCLVSCRPCRRFENKIEPLLCDLPTMYTSTFALHPSALLPELSPSDPTNKHHRLLAPTFNGLQ